MTILNDWFIEQKMYVGWRLGKFSSILRKWGFLQFSSIRPLTDEVARPAATNKPNQSRLNWSIVSPFLTKEQKTV